MLSALKESRCHSFNFGFYRIRNEFKASFLLNIMKQIILIFILTVSGHASSLEPDEIVPKFYELLIQVEKPTKQDEVDFFGGEGSDYIAKVLRTKPAYENSATPIWDYLRLHKSSFLTSGPAIAGKARINYSEPFRSTKLWSDFKSEQLQVYAVFGTTRNEKGSNSGLSMVVFTLGTDCYLKIGETFVSGAVNLFSGQIYEATPNPTK